MFYDTSTLQHNEGGYHVDLTTASGRLWFYGTIRNFWSQIPPRHRARIDGKPLVFLYASAFARRVDEKLFPTVREMFHRDFGTDLFLVKMHGWPGEADSEYQWGGALAPQFLDTAGLGPGYDHSAVPGRTPLIRKREDGQFYRRAWQRLLTKEVNSRPWLVHVETWNEFHEGTDVCESREYGRQYIDLTREFADQFHAGTKLDRSVLRSARQMATASPGKSDGLSIVPKPDGDGPVVEKTVDSRLCWSTAQNKHSPVSRYLYFDVDDAFLFDTDEPVELTIAYQDAGPSEFRVDYDSSDPQLEGLLQQFRPGPSQLIKGTGQWKEARFVLPHARFAGRSNGADFRLAAVGKDLVISSVSVAAVGEVTTRDDHCLLRCGSGHRPGFLRWVQCTHSSCKNGGRIFGLSQRQRLQWLPRSTRTRSSFRPPFDKEDKMRAKPIPLALLGFAFLFLGLAQETSRAATVKVYPAPEGRSAVDRLHGAGRRAGHARVRGESLTRRSRKPAGRQWTTRRTRRITSRTRPLPTSILRGNRFEVQITCPRAVRSAKVLPIVVRHRSRPSTATAISIQLDKPRHLTVEINDTWVRARCTFSGIRRKPDAPRPDDPNVIYLRARHPRSRQPGPCPAERRSTWRAARSCAASSRPDEPFRISSYSGLKTYSPTFHAEGREDRLPRTRDRGREPLHDACAEPACWSAARTFGSKA
jgi:hypothetical protein